MIPLQEPRKPHPFSLFNLGFRPFFLFGALAALLLIGHWLGALVTGWTTPYFQAGLWWHSHEMLFGFSLAIISGFLLTAVRNWTNVQTPYGWTLAGIFAVWLLCRILPFIPAIPDTLIALFNIGFPLLVALGIGVPIVRAGNYRNLVFLVALLGFTLAAVLIHLQLLGITTNTLQGGLHLALYLVVLIIVVIGGRVIPFFTERGIGDVSCTRYSTLEKVIIPLTLVWLLSQLLLPGPLAAAISLTLAALQIIRLYGWYQPAIWQHPLLWILHCGYSFIMLGFALLGLAQLGFINQSIALHAFAVGGIGSLTLGMMARVSLGHTGRPLKVTRLICLAFLMMLVSAVLRVCALWLPLAYIPTLHVAGTFWIMAWLLFLLHYSPILIRPRADGLWG
ncbi:MAG: NnrS family protein [Marinobacterium sp.]|nr:NnrS family protein [Marinobacterium sp.]